MYSISDRQIDYILSDISARGVGMESLQLNLLDHICCIIEQELEENGDFEQFYSATIRKFYKDKLSEIEEETHLLLNNKNYYVMKKVMIYSGAFSAAVLTMGIFFKYMHWPGASIQIVLGIGIASLIFLPLLVTLKVKEQQKAKDKLLIVLGSASAIMMSLAILFKVQHWPGANMMGVASPALLALVFLPIYFFGGIRNAETKVNTIVSSMLIILGCGLFFTLAVTPTGIKMEDTRNTNTYLRSEQILRNEVQQLEKCTGADSANTEIVSASKQLYKACDRLKVELLEFSTGAKAIGEDFDSKNQAIKNASFYDFLNNRHDGLARLTDVSQAVFYYNKLSAANHSIKPIPVKWNILDENSNNRDKMMSALTDVIQMQMIALQSIRDAGTAGQKELVSVQ